MTNLNALKNKAVLTLWTGQILSAMGDQLYIVAANWVATREWGSTGALVSMTFFLAYLIFGVVGGVYADRVNQRTAMITVDLMRAAVVMMLPLGFYFFGGHMHLGFFIGVSFLIGALGSFFEPCLWKSIDAISLGDQSMIGTVTTLMTLPMRIGRVVAPAMVGPLGKVLPIIHFFTLDAVTFVVSAMSILSLDSNYAWKGHAHDSEERCRRSFIAEVRDGVKIMWQHTLLWWCWLTQLIGNVFFANAFIIGLPMYVQQTFGDHIDVFARIVCVYGLSGVITTLFIGYIPKPRYGQFIFLGEVMFGFGLTILGLAKTLPVALLGAVIAAPGGPLGELVLRVIHNEIPKEERGKVFALNNMRLYGGFALGLLLAQPLFKYLPASVVVTCSALVILFIGLIGLVKFSKPNLS